MLFRSTTSDGSVLAAINITENANVYTTIKSPAFVVDSVTGVPYEIGVTNGVVVANPINVVGSPVVLTFIASDEDSGEASVNIVPVVGTLLIIGYFHDKAITPGSMTVSTNGAGSFTSLIVDDQGIDINGGIFYKIAAADDTIITGDAVGGNLATIVALQALNFDVATPLLPETSGANSAAVAQRSIALPPTAPSSADGLGIVFWSNDSQDNVPAGSETWTNLVSSNTEVNGGSSNPAIFVGTRNIASGEQLSTNFSYIGGTTDQCIILGGIIKNTV